MNTIKDQSLTFVLNPAGLEEFYNWVFQLTRPFIKGRSIEINSGQGIFSAILAQGQIPVHLSDPLLANRESLRSKFADTMYIRAVHNIDPHGPDIALVKPKLIHVFDTLFAINIVDKYGCLSMPAIKNICKLLKADGHLVIITQVTNSIYSGLEENSALWRTFNQKQFLKLFAKCEILRQRYINLVAETPNPSPGLSALAIIRNQSQEYS